MVKVEPAQLTDLDDLVNLLNILFSQESEFKPNVDAQKKGLSLILSNNQIGQIFVARYQKKVVGMVSLLFTVSTALGAKVAILEDMVVHPDYRDKGVGSKLLSFARDYALQNAILRITLLTDADNLNAHRFYARHGFSQSAMVAFRQLL